MMGESGLGCACLNVVYCSTDHVRTARQTMCVLLDRPCAYCSTDHVRTARQTMCVLLDRPCAMCASHDQALVKGFELLNTSCAVVPASLDGCRVDKLTKQTD